MSLLGAGSINDYVLVSRIGEGAHGIVFEAQHKLSGDEIALKKIPLTKLDSGLPINIIREIKSLEELDHSNIVHLRDVFPHGASIVLVFDYMPCSLADIIAHFTLDIPEPVAKRYMLQILDGMSYCHHMNIMHRDLKPANVLLSSNGQVKIADFGLASVFDSNNPGRPHSHEVATRWYRAPELLYGAKNYTEAVDLWAIGCTFSELLTRRPLFPGDNDIDQLGRVLQAFGTPTEETWPGVSELPDYSKITFYSYQAQPISKVIPGVSEAALDLLQGFLTYNTSKRLSARQGMQHEYFYATHPPPTDARSLPQAPDRHELNTGVFDDIDINELSIDNLLSEELRQRSLPLAAGHTTLKVTELTSPLQGDGAEADLRSLVRGCTEEKPAAGVEHSLDALYERMDRVRVQWEVLQGVERASEPGRADASNGKTSTPAAAAAAEKHDKQKQKVKAATVVEGEASGTAAVKRPASTSHHKRVSVSGQRVQQAGVSSEVGRRYSRGTAQTTSRGQNTAGPAAAATGHQRKANESNTAAGAATGRAMRTKPPRRTTHK